MTTEAYTIQTPDGEEEHSAGGVAYRRGADGGWEILCLERPRYADWSLPKGHLEPGETAEAAALRELREETGIRGAIRAHLATICYPIIGRSGRPTSKVVDHFLIAADPASGPAAPQPPELDIPHWVPLAGAVATLTHEGERASVRRAAELLGPELAVP